MKPDDSMSAIPYEAKNICSAVPDKWSYSDCNTFQKNLCPKNITLLLYLQNKDTHYKIVHEFESVFCLYLIDRALYYIKHCMLTNDVKLQKLPHASEYFDCDHD
jgi:hypothetical protein